MAFFDIPEHWSTEQAQAVHEFLVQLQERIWDYYEVPLVEAIQREIAGDLHIEPVDFNDDIPF